MLINLISTKKILIEIWRMYKHSSRWKIKRYSCPVGKSLRVEFIIDVIAAAIPCRGVTGIGHGKPRSSHVDGILERDAVKCGICSTASHRDVELEERRRGDEIVPRLCVSHSTWKLKSTNVSVQLRHERNWKCKQLTIIDWKLTEYVNENQGCSIRLKRSVSEPSSSQMIA